MLLITGSQGQLGQELSKLFPNALMPLSTDLDITNFRALNDFVQKHKIETVINAAAYTAVDLAEDEKEKCYAVNVGGVENIVKTGVCVIQISTDYVFDGTGHRPYVETDATAALSVYGQSKLEAERVLLAKAKGAFIIRTSWLYSPYRNNFVKTMMRLSKEKKTISVVADQMGTPTLAEDLAKVIFKVLPHLKAGKKEIYHFSNEGVCSWYDFACAIMEMMKSECRVLPIMTKDYPTKARRPYYSVLSKEKIKKDFDLDILHWRESLKRMFL